MKKIIIFILYFFVSNAWSIPGPDIIPAIKQYYVLLKQLKELKKQVSQAKEMIDQGKRVLGDAEGHYGFGNLYESHSDFQNHDWMPRNWDDALKGLSGGNADRYRELLKAYDRNHYLLSDKQFSKGASHASLKNYKNIVAVNRTATAMSSKEYSDIHDHLSRLHGLVQKIEAAPNTKAAMDLNSRLIAELSYISIEELRMQTLMNHQVAAQQASDDIASRSLEANFNQLPKEK